MFEKFIEESTMNTNKPEIKFFNESIIAKKNRSRARAALSGVEETPFLSDDSGQVRTNLCKGLFSFNEYFICFH